MKNNRGLLFSISLFILAAMTFGFVSSPDTSDRSSQRYDGFLVLPGLTDSVTVYRDERGMPHIYASSEHDLYLTVGYISAQERLWQMDLIRRSACGRLSEIFGKSFLQADIFTRCLQINEKSKSILRNEDPEIIDCMKAYVDGVNSFINSCKKLPLEFRLLSYKPEPWSLEDIANEIGLMGWSLDSRNLTTELLTHEIISKVGIEKASELIPDWQTEKDVAYPDFEISDTIISGTKSFVNSFDRMQDFGVTAFLGSNNWAVSGTRTESGKPLLSNDMHLTLNSPGIWMQMHHIVPGKLNVTGVLIPGEPFIVAGHNDRIAWGMTNLRVDGVDLYAEKINPENCNQYLFNGDWKELRNITEIFNIRGGRQDTVNIRFTHRGPIISGLTDFGAVSAKIKWLGYEFLSNLNTIENRVLSIKWSGYDPSDEVRSIYLLNRAAGWNDFRSGLKTFRSISQNFVYADTEGNIGLAAGGGIPVRKGNGMMIRNGETDEFDWKGYIPFEQLPYIFNPENGQVSSANNKTVSDNYPYFISHSFDLPYRIQRIREMLDEKEIFTVEDFKRMIIDQHSEFAKLLTPYILKLNNRAEELTSLESVALAALSEWDYDMNPRKVAPTILEFFRISFKENLLADELGNLYHQVCDCISEFYIYRLLTAGSDDWVDNIDTPDKEILNDIVMQSFKESIRSLVKQCGKKPKNWEWGKIHKITFMHPLGSVRILASVYDLNSEKFAIGGSEYTVCPYFSYKPGFKADIGASVRHILNTSDWDESYSVIPGGASGIPGSEFYLSQIQTYLDGKFYKDRFSDIAVKSSPKYIQLFIPAD